MPEVITCEWMAGEQALLISIQCHWHNLKGEMGRGQRLSLKERRWADKMGSVRQKIRTLQNCLGTEKFTGLKSCTFEQHPMSSLCCLCFSVNLSLQQWIIKKRGKGIYHVQSLWITNTCFAAISRKKFQFPIPGKLNNPDSKWKAQIWPSQLFPILFVIEQLQVIKVQCSSNSQIKRKTVLKRADRSGQWLVIMLNRKYS